MSSAQLLSVCRTLVGLPTSASFATATASATAADGLARSASASAANSASASAGQDYSRAFQNYHAPKAAAPRRQTHTYLSQSRLHSLVASCYLRVGRSPTQPSLSSLDCVELAQKQLRKSMMIDPSSGETYFLWAMACHARASLTTQFSDWMQAHRAWDRFLSLGATSVSSASTPSSAPASTALSGAGSLTERVSAMVARSDCLLLVQPARVDEALVAAKLAVQEAGQERTCRALAFGQVGRCLLRSGRYAEAAVMFRKSIQEDSSPVWMWLELAELYESSELDTAAELTYQEASRFLSKTKHAIPDRIHLLLRYTLLELRRGNHAKGLAAIDQVFKLQQHQATLDPSSSGKPSSTTYFLHALLLQAQLQGSPAAERPRGEDLKRLLGTIELNLEQAIKQDTRQPFYNLHLSQIHLEQKKLPEAESDCLYELEMNPNAPAWYQLGVVLLSAGDLHRSREAFEKAIQLDPQWRSPQRKLAQLEKKAKQK